MGVFVTIFFVGISGIRAHTGENKYDTLIKGGIYFRLIFEDIPMTIVQLYNVYRGTQLDTLAYVALFGSITGIYTAILDIWGEVIENAEKYDFILVNDPEKDD